MMNSKPFLRYILLLILAVHVFPVSAEFLHKKGVTYYISPTGNDQNDGRKSTPLKSIHRARQLAVPYFGQKEIHFVFQEGVHNLDSTLVITPSQSGSEDYPVIYRAEPLGKAVISGGKSLSLSWEKWKGAICCASVTDTSVTEMDPL